MKQKQKDKIEIINLLPYFGMLVFVGLYFYSTTLYPGGSQVDLNAQGFDYINNYLCNLMNEKGMNGQPNPARPISIISLIILCFSLMSFFVQFAICYVKNRWWRQLIILAGILSMTCAMLIFSMYHDVMIIASSFFGLFVVIGIVREIFTSELLLYKVTGLLCLLLLGINNFIYYTKQFIEWLPLLQKITFVIVLIWIGGLNYELIKKKKERASTKVSIN